MSASRPRIAIVGAGVIGSVLANVLADCDVDLICVERVLPDDRSDSGTGLNICPNGIKALNALSPALADTLIAASLPWRNWRASLTDGTVLFDLPLDRVADRPGIRIRWSQLYELLRAPIASTVHWGHDVDSVSYDADGRVTLTAHDVATGAVARWENIDLVIGADGRYSAIREAIFGPPAVRHFGIALFRALVPDTAGGLIDDYEQWFNGANRLLAYRVPENQIYVSGAFTIDAGAPISATQQTPEYLRTVHVPPGRPPSPVCRWLIDTVSDPAIRLHWARLQEIDDEYVDGRGRVLLLGDAAHAMVPTLGQGATQAFEDAAIAGLVLREVLVTGSDLSATARDIARLREPRISFVKAMSLEATDTMLGADPVSGSRRKVEPPFLAKLTRLYQDIPALIPAAAAAD